MQERTIKQLTIAAIFTVIVGGVGWGFYELSDVEPTCFDTVQNQGEEGVDCGVVCGTSCDPVVVPLEVSEAQLIPAGAGEFDFVAKVRNPNTIHGASTVSYDVIIKGGGGTELRTLHGSFYILPVQTKHVVKTRITVDGEPQAVEMMITSATWNKVSAADLQVDFPLIREQHGPVSDPGVAYQVEGTVANRSDYDFDQVDTVVILRDAEGVIRALSTTTINTFLSQSLRYFKVTWPARIAGEGLTPQVEAGTNVFNNQNFIRRYGTQELFQQFR